MVTAMRYAEKAVSFDGTRTVVFPLDMYEFTDSGPLRNAFRAPELHNYAYDHLQRARSPRDLANVSIRFMASHDTPTETDYLVDQLKSTMLAFGPFWLYTLGADGTRRRAKCRLKAIPEIQVSYRRHWFAPVNLDMIRFSDWYSDQLITETINLVPPYPVEFAINNPGNLPADEIVIRVQSDGNPSFSQPDLQNMTNGFRFKSLRNATNADDEVKLDTAEPSIRWSVNDGATYVDDITNYSFPTTQAALSFLFDVGPNQLRYTQTDTLNGTVTLVISYYPKYA